MEQIEITIGKDGKVKFHVQGAKGQKCLDLTKPLELALGTVEERHKTAEFYAGEPAPIHQKERG